MTEDIRDQQTSEQIAADNGCCTASGPDVDEIEQIARRRIEKPDEDDDDLRFRPVDWVAVGPEQSRKAVAGLWVSGHGKICDQRSRFARVHLDRAPATLDARWPQQLQDEASACPPAGRDGPRTP